MNSAEPPGTTAFRGIDGALGIAAAKKYPARQAGPTGCRPASRMAFSLPKNNTEKEPFFTKKV
jgi:hypothetical protein